MKICFKILFHFLYFLKLQSIAKDFGLLSAYKICLKRVMP